MNEAALVTLSVSHTFGAQGPAVVDVPLQFPSDPIYPAQVVIVPEYVEHALLLVTQAFPFETQPAL